jgi:hypothetical protein
MKQSLRKKRRLKRCDSFESNNSTDSEPSIIKYRSKPNKDIDFDSEDSDISPRKAPKTSSSK